jgi:putative glutamine amidotransferase
VPPRIAIPMPHSTDREYGERAIPQYERAVTRSGGEPVRILLDRSSQELRKLIENCEGVLLPGSNADVNPARFKQETSSQAAAPDLRREEVDDLLLEHAYASRKPVLGICYGLQSLNVFRHGSLIQHIPDFLPEATRTKVNHEAGRTVSIAHRVEIARDSLLASIVAEDRSPTADISGPLSVPVNSSHHQSAEEIGDGLRIVARCPDDGIIEALEGTSPDHFLLAVQWHPERSVEDDDCSRRIFRALIEAASQNGKR